MGPLELKFNEHFYSSTNEAKLLDLTSARQTRDESVVEYFKLFKEIKNQCFNLSISEKDLADLAFQGLRSYLREKLEGHIYLSLTQLQQFALVKENRIKHAKEVVKPPRRDVHMLDYSFDSSDDESNDVFAAEFIWPSRPNL